MYRDFQKRFFKILLGFFFILYCALHLFVPRYMAFAAETAAEHTLEGFEDSPQMEEKMDQGLDGFNDTNLDELDEFPGLAADIDKDVAKENQNSNLTIGGFIKFETEYAFNRDHKKLSKVRPCLFVETFYKINPDLKFKASALGFYDFAYVIESKSEFLDETLDDNEYDIELRDFYLDGKLTDTISLKTGRQIIAWGDSDYARITDVINPRDLTQPGLIDLEDARLPLFAVRLSAFFDPWSFDVATIHEHPGSKIAGLGSDFDYYAVFRDPSLTIATKKTPDSGLDNSGFAARAAWSYNGGDLALVVADTYDHQPYLVYDGIFNDMFSFTPEYDRFTTFGFSGNLVKDNSLFKLEAAFRKDRKLMRNDVIYQIMSGIPVSGIQTTNSQDQIAVLTGIEYTGISDLRLSLEGEMLHTLDYKPYLSVDEFEYRTYVQATYQMLNDTLEFDLFWVHFNPGHGNILRLSSKYDIFDAFTVQAGMAFYDSSDSDSLIHPYKGQDRFFLRLKYSF
ncbi:MAG: hypothetical protein GY729_02255 [Desulfobacteraceae bacterium]|nr:hypothetical protein [Desulfobacteraceae bacterium]